MNCKNCGAEYSDDQLFCVSCGQNLSNEQNQENTTAIPQQNVEPIPPVEAVEVPQPFQSETSQVSPQETYGETPVAVENTAYSADGQTIPQGEYAYQAGDVAVAPVKKPLNKKAIIGGVIAVAVVALLVFFLTGLGKLSYNKSGKIKFDDESISFGMTVKNVEKKLGEADDEEETGSLLTYSYSTDDADLELIFKDKKLSGITVDGEDWSSDLGFKAGDSKKTITKKFKKYIEHNAKFAYEAENKEKPSKNELEDYIDDMSDYSLVVKKSGGKFVNTDLDKFKDLSSSSLTALSDLEGILKSFKGLYMISIEFDSEDKVESYSIISFSDYMTMLMSLGSLF